MTILVLGDQLTRERGPIATHPDEDVLMIEAHGFARRVPYHPHKLILVFSAMRHFRDALAASGRCVQYHVGETFAAGFDARFAEHPGDTIRVMAPTSHGATERLEALVTDRGGTLEVGENPLFLCSDAQFDRWADGRDLPYRQEAFYRFMRRETGYLMSDDEPVGGQWNYDDANREPPTGDECPPTPPRFDPDEITADVADWVYSDFDGGYADVPFGGGWADPEPFTWPVTREAALEGLSTFVEHRLAAFGPTQDAMLADHWAMHHSLLSGAMNIGLLHPAEVVEAVIAQADDDPTVPTNSVEGFVRQVIGWREFMRQVYRQTMPELAHANTLDANEDLPDFYWTGKTQMACLRTVIDGVRSRGYSHHIERLMVLSNFGLLLGVEPAQLNRWFHAAYIDAFHWVTTPNVVEMGLYAHGAFATKPYAASANYIDRMSDFCADCRYAPDEVVGEKACPFNALYWAFLDRHEASLSENPRMALMYHHLESKDREAIRDRADDLRDRVAAGDL